MITSPPDTVDDGIGPMPRSLDQEYVTLPEWELRRVCEVPISYLDALTVGTLEDYLTFCGERWPTYHESLRRAHQIYHDIGRFQGFPDSGDRARKAEQVLRALQDLDHRLHLAIGRAHGLQQQTVRFVRRTGYDGLLFQLTTLPLQRSFSTGRSS